MFSKGHNGIEHIKLSEKVGCDIEQDFHGAHNSSCLFSIGKMFANKRKKRIMSKGIFYPVYNLSPILNFGPFQVLLLKVCKQ